MKSSTVVVWVVVGALMAGCGRMGAPAQQTQAPAQTGQQPVVDTSPAGSGAAADAASNTAAADTPTLGYADVLKVEPVTSSAPVYATVVNSVPINETTTATEPKEVCEDVAVQERQPERDGNVGGTVVGAVVGGLVGNQVGKGDGRKAATVVGAVAGVVIGNQVDKRHEGGKVVQRTERQCHTEQVPSQSTRVTGYTVTYRKADGSTGSMRMDSQPGNRINLGNAAQTNGYDVTYRYNGEEKKIRMDNKPSSDRLPVIDGQVVTQTAAGQ